MKLICFVYASFLLIFSDYVVMSTAHGPRSWGVGNGGIAGSWSSATSIRSGQPGANGPYSYGYAGIDANGMSYAGQGGNAVFNVHITDNQGHEHTYSGGGVQGGYDQNPLEQPDQQSCTSIHSYAKGNQHSQRSSSESSYASVWSTFYMICLFSLFLLIKS